MLVISKSFRKQQLEWCDEQAGHCLSTFGILIPLHIALFNNTCCRTGVMMPISGVVHVLNNSMLHFFNAWRVWVFPHLHYKSAQPSQRDQCFLTVSLRASANRMHICVAMAIYRPVAKSVGSSEKRAWYPLHVVTGF